jgi:DNA (cytosine-5)-methyltransferase 1
MKKHLANLKLVYSVDKNLRERGERGGRLSTIDLFCGAGGITEGFRGAHYQCLYANDSMPEAIKTFQENHPGTWAECGKVELVKPFEIRAKLKIRKGDLDVLVGGPPCQGFSINAPERFLSDPRNKLFKDYVRFLEVVSL